MTTLVQAVEFHKIQNGSYPESLQELRKALPNDSMVFVHDASIVGLGDDPVYFHYELVNDAHYVLLGRGPDGVPFTGDDLVPEIDVSKDSDIGLLIRAGSLGDN